MKIRQIKINAYGKFKKKEIKLKPGINIIYGKNEAGKSTLLSFLVNCFYGISKNKKGKTISDYEKYKPWIGEEFSGKIQYELENQRIFEVYRDFSKKNPSIFNEKGEDISKEFSIDKTKGNQFFYEQTQMEEELFLSTLVSQQQEVKLEKTEENRLLQRIANLVGTGEDNVSYQKAVDRINRRQLEEIGTERSREKPINVLQRELDQLREEKQQLEKELILQEKIEEEKVMLQQDIFVLEKENHLLKDYKLVREKQKLAEEKLKVKQELKTQNEEKMKQAKDKLVQKEMKNNDIMKTIKNEKRKKDTEKKKINLLFSSAFLIFMMSYFLQTILLENRIIGIVLLILLPITILGWLFMVDQKNREIRSLNQEKNSSYTEEMLSIQNEIKIWKDTDEQLEKEISELRNQNYLNYQTDLDKIRTQYEAKMEPEKIESLLMIEDFEKEIQENEKESNIQRLRLHTIELQEQTRQKYLERLVEIEENMVDHNNKIVNFQMLNESMNLAKEVLTKAYEKMKNSVTPRFTENLSATIQKITGGKYAKVQFDDETGFSIELEDGNYVSADRLSIGTIDQLYLSLRLAMMDDLSKEKVPIILDEAFAFYDKERLANILNYMKQELQDRQVLIFTCTNREKEILEQLNEAFHWIEL